MSNQGEGRLRAYLQFLAAVIWFFVARSLAHRGALSLATEQWAPLAEELFLVFLLVVGNAALGFWLNRQLQAVSQQGLPLRTGWQREARLGMAVGWSLAVVCVLPMALLGGVALSVSARPASWAWLLADAAFFALWALAEEVAFRGYGFQRFVQAVGPIGASLGFAAIYAIVQAQLPGASHVSIGISVVLSLGLSLAYLRSNALWVSWGLNFAWKASRGLLFGLAICGNNSHSPVVQGDPMGPFWLTGGGFGLDGSWLAFFVLIAALPVIYRVTRELDYRYNTLVIVPGGIPVNLDAAARTMHDAAMATPAPAAPQLIQILPAAPPPTSGPLDEQKS
jgi:membrane protease YdiL (CAAX protease family)